MNLAIKTVSCFLLLSIVATNLHAQCPPAMPGSHRVLKGETLYQISKKYNITVDQLCTWNNIQPKDILIICQELRVAPTNTPIPTKPAPTAIPGPDLSPQGGTHRIKQGETIAGLAELYGYTEQKFREFNGLSSSEPAWPGLVLRTSDCRCDYLPTGEEPVYVENGKDTDKMELPGIPPTALSEFPTWEETIADNDTPASSGSQPFGEDPFGGSQPAGTTYSKRIDTPNAPTLYNSEIEKIAAPGQKPSATAKTETEAIDPRVKQSESGANAPEKTYLTPEEELIRANRKTPPASTTPASTIIPPIEELPAIKDAGRYMTAEEIEMVKEINLVRSNPAGYVKYIEAYKEDIVKGKAPGSVSTCDELIAELKVTPTLPFLQPIECLYNAAKKHGEDQRPTGSIDHVGTDGSSPWDRIRRACPNMNGGKENIIGGPEKVRDAVIVLLIDHGITNRVHRRTIMDKSMRYVACYKIGQVGRMPANWVQNFSR